MCDVCQFVGVENIAEAFDLPIRYVDCSHSKQGFTCPHQYGRLAIDIFNSNREVGRRLFRKREPEVCDRFSTINWSPGRHRFATSIPPGCYILCQDIQQNLYIPLLARQQKAANQSQLGFTGGIETMPVLCKILRSTMEQLAAVCRAFAEHLRSLLVIVFEDFVQ